MARHEVLHDPETRRFVAPLEGSEGVLTYRVAEDDVLDFTHTWVPPSHREGGSAKPWCWKDCGMPETGRCA